LEVGFTVVLCAGAAILGLWLVFNLGWATVRWVSESRFLYATWTVVVTLAVPVTAVASYRRGHARGEGRLTLAQQVGAVSLIVALLCTYAIGIMTAGL
jgi:hypothetical protein